MGLVATVFLANALAPALHATPLEVLEVVFFASLVLALVKFFFMVANPHNRNEASGLVYDVAVEFWDTIIAKNLYRGYEWLGRAKNRDANVLGGKVVHIPQAGATPNVVRNRTQYPIPFVKRSDTDITYVIDELSSDTTAVFEAEKWELSYAKIPDVLDDHIKEISKRTAQNALFRYLGSNPSNGTLNAANIIRTSGATTGHLLTGATGTRNKLMVADVTNGLIVIKSQTKKDLNTGKRALILTLESYNELRSDSALDSSLKYDVVGAVFKDGELVKLAGLDIIVTDVLPRFSNAGTPLAKDSLDTTVANAVTDNDVSMIVDFDYVHIARSATKMFYEANNTEMQADIMNALSRMGASRERFDQAGIVAIVQQ